MPNAPFHRICTLARKMGAKSVALESALNIDDVREEIDELDGVLGPKGSAQAVAVTFFYKDISLDNADFTDTDVIGQCILINYQPPEEKEFTHSYVFEAIIKPPSIKLDDAKESYLLNNFISSEKNLFSYSVK